VAAKTEKTGNTRKAANGPTRLSIEECPPRLQNEGGVTTTFVD
jgi:hypothetical protein